MFSEYGQQLAPFSLFGDTRLNEAFPKMVEELGESYSKSIPQSAPDNAKMQSYYNFFLLPKLNMNICF